MYPETFGKFWFQYLENHRHRATRMTHFFGTVGGAFVVGIAFLTWHPLFVLVGVFIPYGSSWYGHYRWEGKPPVTLQHPVWAIRGDIELCRLMFTRGIDAELRKLKSS